MKHRSLTFILALVLAAPLPLAAQVTERPIPFDSIGRVPAITPRLADRLRLGPPLWPVLGRFVSAQLFSSTSKLGVEEAREKVMTWLTDKKVPGDSGGESPGN